MSFEIYRLEWILSRHTSWNTTNSKNPSDYKIYNLDYSKQVYASNKKIENLQYPDLKNEREYILYIVGEEIDVKTSFDVKAIKESTVPKHRNGVLYM